MVRPKKDINQSKHLIALKYLVQKSLSIRTNTSKTIIANRHYLWAERIKVLLHNTFDRQFR
jgi:hypothetical protein